MVEAQEIKPCLFCDSATDMFVHEEGEANWVQCKCCGAEGGVGKTRKEAIDIWNKPWKLGVKPLPCLRDQNGEMFARPVKQFVMKVQEEFAELIEAILDYGYSLSTAANLPDMLEEQPRAVKMKKRIAEEAADVKTAITTLEQVLGIDEAMRDELQDFVNKKNRARGRL